ncbi:hypothetical protein BA059_10970 [Mycolicibacterium sp. (ex Dasyatis americana)]|uniref:Uncharacterized protein n=1 Tax=Mycobacterium syngnathidarum TaxID=1908205 RepID=A0A1Q9WIG6_9MYCO|nr:MULTISPECIES: hypothetical protein [Mycobacterium]OFB39974.1 hypothetical protein BA059_10970 [Mycolicibacterium sp. (ex Dasyatis americana)]MCG7607485.1 hypothetical protein [Mycobacterium sp. CnD-18-1]OHU07029.1 hypothetical protein BKG61_04010 [Mycobacterium syngnathidarum]OLT98593.1 hypothetical protein BKG60_01075 [Mycobacterium syngnathidarum]TMS55736.1 hypothetical protein E0T84_00770 [Mycobacterium sp. DBP42]
MPGFVVEFNRRTRERRVREFDDPGDAMRMRLQLESERVDGDIEIAALTSKSLETLQRTHSRYFTGKELTAI